MIPDGCAASYLAALERADLEAVTALFTDDGVVHSPLYGAMPARDFYAGLFADTARSKTTPKAVFTTADGSRLALHFAFDWTLASGKTVRFEVVDVFRLAADGRFAELTIIYDTAPLRADFEASRRAA
jgi:ketosteroid isomerase-like protein